MDKCSYFCIQVHLVFFHSGQKETNYPDGTKQINFPDGTVRHLYPNGEEKDTFVNGTVQYIHSNGDKTIEFHDGQREVHTKKYKVSYTCTWPLGVYWPFVH